MKNWPPNTETPSNPRSKHWSRRDFPSCFTDRTGRPHEVVNWINRRRAILTTVVCGLVSAICLPGCNQDESNGTKPSGGSTVSSADVTDTAKPTTKIAFRETALSAGVNFTYRNGIEAAELTILESLGGGIALWDYDLDGNVDLFIPGGGGFPAENTITGNPSAMFRNLGPAQFSRVTDPAGLHTASRYSHGAIVADYDNDGFPDLLVTGFGGLMLFHNQGDGTFENESEAAGLTDKLWSTSAGWGDINNDGALDLYIVHYVDWSFENNPSCGAQLAGKDDICPPREFEPLPDVCYLGNGDGTFRDASQELGLRQDGKGLGVVLADVDLNGHTDIYVTNDTTANFLYLNSGNGGLREEGLESGTAVDNRGVSNGSMGVDVADFNVDGWPDIWVTNYQWESIALYRNEGGSQFQYISQLAGITAVNGLFVGWGTAFSDFDGDSDEDVFVTNGHVVLHPSNAPILQEPHLFENMDGRRLINVAPAAGSYLSQPHNGRGVAVGDIDRDGDVDVAVSHLNAPVALLLNESNVQSNWLSLRLIGTNGNRDAIGAHIKLETASGTQSRLIKGGGSYASTSDRRVHFGLGESAVVKQVEIRWPSGMVETFSDVSANQWIELVEASGNSTTIAK